MTRRMCTVKLTGPATISLQWTKELKGLAFQGYDGESLMRDVEFRQTTCCLIIVANHCSFVWFLKSEQVLVDERLLT